MLDEFTRLLPLPKKKPRRKRGKKKPRDNRSNSGQPDPNKGRASEYASNQDLWDKNKRHLWDLIRLGDICSKTEGNDAHFFGPIFAKETQCFLEDSPSEYHRPISLTQYITKEDIERFVSKKLKSSPGPDGILAGQVRVRLEEFTVLLNCGILALDIPDQWRQAGKILLPKKDGADEPGDFRPITISSILYCCLSAVLADRLSKCVQLTSNQKGFITGDGIHEAISTLRFLLKHRNDTRIAALDVLKAFDSVNQDAIFVACKRKGLDAASVGLLRNMYRNCSTRIRLNGVSTRDSLEWTDSLDLRSKTRG